MCFGPTYQCSSDCSARVPTAFVYSDFCFLDYTCVLLLTCCYQTVFGFSFIDFEILFCTVASSDCLLFYKLLPVTTPWIILTVSGSSVNKLVFLFLTTNLLNSEIPVCSYLTSASYTCPFLNKLIILKCMLLQFVPEFWAWQIHWISIVKALWFKSVNSW